MSYNFKEANLGKDFAKEKLADFKELIDSSRSFVVLSMPGVGVSYFLKYLATQSFAKFFHIDIYSLPSLTQEEFFKLLSKELGEKLEILAKKHSKIVLIFSRFDQLKKEFNNQFLSSLQSLTNIAPGKIVLIFTSTKPLTDISAEILTGGNLNFFSEILYFKPYSEKDLRKLLTIEPPREVSDEIVKLSGGHNQLLQILRRSQKQQNLLLDQFVKLQLKGLIDYLDYSQRKQLQKIALGKKVEDIDEYLLGVGLINKDWKIFTPLLAEYIKQNVNVKLPVKEAKLFKLLRKSVGNVVSKDEIFAEVWPEEDGATDWALDALIYRLRKHPFIKTNGYIIESHKKIGYTLIQI